MLPPSADGGYPPDNLAPPVQGQAPSYSLPPGLGAGIAPPLFSPPQAPPVLIDIPDSPTPEFIAEAKAYFLDWCEQSYDYVQTKVPEWRRATKLIHNQLKLSDLEEVTVGLSRNPDEEILGNKGGHRSDFVYPIGPSCNAFASSGLSAIISGPDPFVVQPTRIDSPDDLTTARKVQQLLMEGLDDGKFYSNLFTALYDLPGYGTQYGKVYWHRETVRRVKFNPLTQQVEEHEEIVRECPIVQPISLDRMLVDPYAKHSDIQRWRAIGNRVLRTYDQVLEAFSSGAYDLNQDEVISRWGAQGGTTTDQTDDLDGDPDLTTVRSSPLTSWLEVWEVHGRVPSASMGRHIECSATILAAPNTTPGSVTVRSGVLVRLTTRPILDCGLRPYVAGKWSPHPHGPFAHSLEQSTKDLYVQLSQFMAQLQDAARFSIQPVMTKIRGTAGADALGEDATLYPGRIIEVDRADNLQYLQPPNMNLQAIMSAIQMLSELRERDGAGTDTFMGVSSTRKTATEATILQQQSQVPYNTTLNLFVRDYVQPALNLCLELYRQFSDDDRVVMIKGPAGQLQPQQLTAQELKSQKFKVVVTLTNQDVSRVAKASSIQQLLTAAPNLQQLLMQSGKIVDWGELITRYVDLLGIDGADRIVSPLPPMPPQMPGMMGGGMPDMGMGGGPPGMSSNPQNFLAQNGGPMGQQPTDANQLAAMLQYLSTSNTSGNAPQI